MVTFRSLIASEVVEKMQLNAEDVLQKLQERLVKMEQKLDEVMSLPSNKTKTVLPSKPSERFLLLTNDAVQSTPQIPYNKLFVSENYYPCQMDGFTTFVILVFNLCIGVFLVLVLLVKCLNSCFEHCSACSE